MKLYKRGKTWYVDAREEGHGRVSTGTADRRKAEDFAKRMLRGIGNGHTLTDAMERAWSEYYQDTKGARNVNSQMNRVKTWYGSRKLTDIDTPWLKEVQGDLRKHASVATVNRYMALIGKVLGLCVEWGWLEHKPQVPHGKEQGHRLRTISEAEELELLAYFNDECEWMLNLTAFLLDTGARLSEALRISAEEQRVAIATRKWTIWEAKGGKPRTIPLTGRAHMALREGGWRGKTARQAQDQWSYARAAMGLAKDKGFVLHALRHTCATRLVDRDVPLPVIRDYLGHASITTTERYAHLNPRALEVAALCLESVSTGAYNAPVQAIDPSGIKGLAKDGQTVNLTAQPSVVQIHPPPISNTM